MIAAYRSVRNQTQQLCQPLAVEDCVVQTMKLVSPTKWHLAHTTWFFEQFMLMNFFTGYQPYNEQYLYLFNSYYNTVGPQHCQAQRGYLSRPTVEEVYTYRQQIDAHMIDLLLTAPQDNIPELRNLLVVGINHEQQHQELILTDIKHVFSSNPLMPAYNTPDSEPASHPIQSMHWIEHQGGLADIGFEYHKLSQDKQYQALSDLFQIDDGLAARALLCSEFCFDNEKPKHTTFLQPFAIANRLVTNGEYMGFLEDQGYEKPEFWLSLGWQWRKDNNATHPLYWYKQDDIWKQYTLAGPLTVDPNEPLCHVNYFEADAFARWAGYRLPREDEWESATSNCKLDGNLMESNRFHPITPDPQSNETKLIQAFGDVWEWTSSPYTSYPGYQPADGALGEYNGKFMCNQQVLRGGSCATPTDHIRNTYRNFWSPETRWQFTGIRLARDI
ncbi:ergothioneine biosynthesis protein EgtB [Planctomycetota bacterium]|nr:ergothioneine biosynthesis protein EgtB [Planctomycetota bacterium]